MNKKYKRNGICFWMQRIFRKIREKKIEISPHRSEGGAEFIVGQRSSILLKCMALQVVTVSEWLQGLVCTAHH